MLARRVNEVRAAAGLPLVVWAPDAWIRCLPLIATIPELDTAAASAAPSARYVGPIVEEYADGEWESPWHPADRRPLILCSFTTTGFWDQRGRIQRTLEALADEPVRVLLSGPETSELARLPANAAARRFVPHARVLPLVAAVVTHCGHGTLCAAFAHGLPVVGLPNQAADQPFLARRAEELGAGVALDGDAPAEAIRSAVRKVLSEPAYATAAGRLGAAIVGSPGARGAAIELERLAARDAR